MAKTEFTLIRCPAAGNNNSKGAAYNRTAGERSWKALMEFLTEIISR